MKSKFLRILALILVMSSLISMFAIFASAAESAGGEGRNTETEQNPFKLIYSRTYDEGWNLGNGMTVSGSDTSFKIDYEKIGDKYNYFWRMALGTAGEYAELPGVSEANVGSVIEFDIMTGSTASASNPVVIQTNGATDGETAAIDLMKITENKVYLMGSDEVSFTMKASKWYRIQLIFNYTDSKLTVSYVPVDGSATASVVEKEGLQGNGIKAVRFQSSEGDKESLCFDNVKYYEGTSVITNITKDMGYGSGIDEKYEKTETILGGSSAAVDLASVLSMKVGVDYCYYNKERTPIFDKDGTVYGAPVKVGGEVMVPLLMVLKYIGYTATVDGTSITVSGASYSASLTVGKNTASVGGETVGLDAAPAYRNVSDSISYLVIALGDVEKLFAGYYGDYDEMGYITVSQAADILDRSTNLSSMLSVMKQFVFDIYDGDTIYNDVAAKTNFVHPYILANADQLAAISTEYKALLAENEATPFTAENEKFWKLRGYNGIVEAGETAYRIYAELDSNKTYDTYNGILGADKIDTDYSLVDSDYDKYGRSEIAERTKFLENMAYAYVLTGDTKYLQLSYEVAMQLGTWAHWGPGNFVDCAEASSSFAIYYDWTYQGYVALAAAGVKREGGASYDVKELAKILAKQGVHEGYLSSVSGKCEHTSNVLKLDGQEGYSYSKRKNSWSAVCVGGMTIASLAILDGNAGILPNAKAGETYLDEAKALLAADFNSLINNGLDIYAPDGSYIDGAEQWNYGTNSFFRMCAALDSATGGNYGLMDSWGIDTTCYYACHTEDNNSNYFPYHESATGSYDTGCFFYVAGYFGDATLYNVRYNQINSDTKAVNILDFIYYPTADDLKGAGDIQLDYYSEKVDLFATRSSWEKDALYASIAGGKNSDYHGQMDAGSFVYHNGGNVWICDLGTENADCKGLWDSATKYRYYVMKPEGNNTVAIYGDVSGTPYGQIANAEAKATAWDSNEYGSYVVYDMGATLGGQVVKWQRGMLLTNDRKTTVIQDQISFNSMNIAYWFAHYNVNVVDGGVTLSSDGRTAYMRDYIGTNEHGERLYKTLRLSIVSANESYTFQLMTTYQFIHTSEEINGKKNSYPTYSADEVSALGGASEYRRDNYRKLAISSGEVLGFDIAVAIELVDDTTIGKSTEIGVGYEYAPMSTWEPAADTREFEDKGDSVDRRGTPNADIHLVESIDIINGMKDTLYTDNINTYFERLADAHYAVNMIGSDMPKSYSSYVSEFQKYREEFSAYRNVIVKLGKTQNKFVNKLMSVG